MRSDQERREDIRDEMLIDMARALQALLYMSPSESFRAMAAASLVGRLDGHIAMLKGAKDK